MGNYSDAAQRIGAIADAGAGGFTAADQMLRGTIFGARLAKLVVDGAIGDVTTAFEGTDDENSDAIYVPYALTITAAKLMPLVGLTADASNYATITLGYADGAGGAVTAIATLDTTVAGGGSWVSGTAKAMTLTSSNPVAVPAGSWLTFSIAKTGTGVAVQPFRIAASGLLT